MQIYQMIPQTLRVGSFGIQHENQEMDLTEYNLCSFHNQTV
jgi:hypothetical protein